MVQIGSLFYAILFAEFVVGSDLNIKYTKYLDTLATLMFLETFSWMDTVCAPARPILSQFIFNI